MKKIFCFFLMIFFVQINLTAQENGDDDWDEWEKEFDVFYWYKESRPFIELNYGFGEPKHKKFENEFSDVGLAEIKLGYNSLDKYENFIFELDKRYLFLSGITSGIASAQSAGSLESKLLRFGLGSRQSYGYKIGDVGIFPYTEDDFVWSKLNMEEFPEAASDLDIINRYEGSFRFGVANAGGISLNYNSFLSVNAAYEAAVVYPRYLVWKNLLSLLIKGIGVGSIDFFVKEIMEASPAAGPVVNFFLKNAFSYGFYLLQRDNMNWPFQTETPLTYETFKVGVSFSF